MDVMGIASMSMYLSQANLMQDVGTAVLGMAMDSGEMQGQDMAAMLENSVNPSIGSNIDISL